MKMDLKGVFKFSSNNFAESKSGYAKTVLVATKENNRNSRNFGQYRLD